MLQFGPLSAEADGDLLTYFHLTSQAETLVDFKTHRPTFILIARPGGGKTALRKWLEGKAATDLTIALTSDRFRLSLEDEEQPNAGDLRLLFESELLTAIASEAVEKDVLSDKLRKETMQHLDTVWQTVLGKFFSQRFAGVSVLGIGFTLKPGERRAYLQAVRSSDQLKALGEQLKKIAAEKRLLLVVDNPEEIVGRGLQDITPENAIRIGALLSVLGRVHRMGVNVVCFLKEQIFQSVREDYPDVSHFVDQVDGLAWSAEDLLALLDTRVMRRLKSKWSQVFAISPSELRERILPFLSNGPRDLLTLCNIAGAKSELITESELLAGVKILRDDRLKDLTSQYKQWPRLALLTSALIAALREKYTTGVLPAGAVKAVFVEQFSKTRSAIYRLREIDWVDRARWESPPIDERLFVAGILGYVQNDGQKIYPWSGREIAQFRLAASHFVSPLFASA